jgi:hypothetical protein
MLISLSVIYFQRISSRMDMFKSLDGVYKFKMRRSFDL